MNTDFCFKKNGQVYKTLPKRLTTEQRYVLRYVQFYLGINPHAPYGVEAELAESLNESTIFGGEKTSKRGKELSDIAFQVALTQKNTVNNKRLEV